MAKKKRVSLDDLEIVRLQEDLPAAEERLARARETENRGLKGGSAATRMSNGMKVRQAEEHLEGLERRIKKAKRKKRGEMGCMVLGLIPIAIILLIVGLVVLFIVAAVLE